MDGNFLENLEKVKHKKIAELKIFMVFSSIQNKIYIR